MIPSVWEVIGINWVIGCNLQPLLLERRSQVQSAQSEQLHAGGPGGSEAALAAALAETRHSEWFRAERVGLHDELKGYETSLEPRRRTWTARPS